MKTKSTLLSIAIIAVLPFTANAENISGNMYTAPATYDTNHPAPTTIEASPFGRVNIDTNDQGHIATTAYVKGAYNSAIAAVNTKQDSLSNSWTGDFITGAVGGEDFFYLLDNADDPSGDGAVVTAGAVAQAIKSQRIEIYTDFNNDSAKTDVSLITVLPQD